MEFYEVMRTIDKYVEISVHWGRINAAISDNGRKMSEILNKKEEAKAFKKTKLVKELTDKYNTYEQVQIKNKKELAGMEETLNLQHKKFELAISNLSGEQLDELCKSIDEKIKNIFNGIKLFTAQRDNFYKNATKARDNNDIDKANDLLEKAKDADNYINFDADSIEYYKSIVINLRIRNSEKNNSQRKIY